MKRLISTAAVGAVLACLIIAFSPLPPVAAQANSKVYKEQGGDKLVVDDGGTAQVSSGGILTVLAGGKVLLPTTTLGTTTTGTAGYSGITYIATAEDITFTLPAAAAGLRYRIHAGSISGATGLTVHPVSPAKMYGNGFTAAAAKGAILTHATARLGDFIEVYSDGTDWWITSISGTWARES